MAFERWFTVLAARLRALFAGGTLDRDLDEELSYHVDRLTAEHVARGLEPVEARRLALAAFGGVERRKEECRDMRRTRFLEEIASDFRYGVRMLHRSPAFTLVAVLSLSTGIGATTAIFSVADALLLRPLPVRQPKELVAFETRSGASVSGWFAYPQYADFRDRLPEFAGIAAVANIDRFNIAVDGPGGGVDSRQEWTAAVSGNYFDVLGVRAHLGRVLTPADDEVRGGSPVAVISYSFWQRRFAGSKAVVGRSLAVNGTSFTVVGVVPRGFTGELIGRATAFWVPMSMQPLLIPESADYLRNPAVTWVSLFGRLRPGSSVERATAAADLAWRQAELTHRRELPAQVRSARLTLAPLSNAGSPLRTLFEEPLEVLLAIAACLFAIACGNTATLLLARSSARQQEIAIRRALGAGRGRIIRQLLTEGVVLAMPACIGGVFLGMWAAGAAPSLMDTNSVLGAVQLDVHLEPRLLAFCVALGILTIVLFALGPAISGSTAPLSPALKASTTDMVTRAPRFLSGKSMVVVQVALSMVLLTAAMLFTRTLQKLGSQDAGFERERVLLLWTRHGQTGLGRGPALIDMYRTAQDRLASIPGVQSVTFSGHRLFASAPRSPITIEGYSEPADAVWDYTDPRFLRTLRIPLIHGRDFTDADNQPTSAPVAIVNETFARRFFGTTDGLGRRFAFRGVKEQWTVIGVVGDSRLDGWRDGRYPEFYIAHRSGRNLSGVVWFALRTSGDPLDIASQAAKELQGINDRLAVFRINTMEEEIARSLGRDRTLAALSRFFGLAAAALTFVGLYGVTSFAAARRTHEFGVRLALGASRAAVVRGVVVNSLTLGVAGVAVGVPAALTVTNLLRARLFGISPGDPMALGLAGAIMLITTIFSGVLPARRAARVDPVRTLRAD